MKRKRSKIKIALVVLIAGLVFLIFFGDRAAVRWDKRLVLAQRQPWLTIFVHGSFGSVLSLLNAKQVLADEVEGTAYKKAAGRMRKESYFFGDQPVLGKGLVPVTPTFDVSVIDNKKYAVYPMLKVYEAITEYAKPDKEQQFFYTFGWSGLISQARRRKEAIRLYNALQEELEKYHKIGIKPKVRLVTHSHGGNMVAYLSAIEELVNSDKKEKILFEQKDDWTVALANMHEQLKKLPFANQRKKKGQKTWDYKPKKEGLQVDELIMWGAPVQPETDCLFANSFFKTVYHFYSQEDLVQRIDWVSTKQGYSNRRFDAYRLGQHYEKRNNFNRILQARIMVGKKINTFGRSAFSLGTNKNQDVEPKKPWWKLLFSGGSLVNAVSDDPTHRELWFFTWDRSNDETRDFALKPFPAMVFTPVLTQLYKRDSLLNDVDININAGLQHAAFELVAHGEDVLQKGFLVKKRFLHELAQKIEPWQCKRASSLQILDLIRQCIRFS